jgi:prolipoprotein diacylglyceryltransferase
MLLYAVSRYVVEFYRGDPRGVVLGMSTSQFISLLIGPLSVVMLVWLARRRSAPSPESAEKRAA